MPAGGAQRQGAFGMESLISFFTLRPTFSLLGLKAVWYVYLLNTAVQAYFSVAGFSQVMAQRGIGWDVGWAPFIPVVLGILAQLLIVRLLIEVAAIVISSQAPKNG
jgi:hypothetical protein